MNYFAKPTIQDVIDIAKSYAAQGISREEAVRRAVATVTASQKQQKPQTSPCLVIKTYLPAELL